MNMLVIFSNCLASNRLGEKLKLGFRAYLSAGAYLGSVSEPISAQT